MGTGMKRRDSIEAVSGTSRIKPKRSLSEALEKMLVDNLHQVSVHEG
jgi:hypothetical protein